MLYGLHNVKEDNIKRHLIVVLNHALDPYHANKVKEANYQCCLLHKLGEILFKYKYQAVWFCLRRSSDLDSSAIGVLKIRVGFTHLSDIF